MKMKTKNESSRPLTPKERKGLAIDIILFALTVVILVICDLNNITASIMLIIALSMLAITKKFGFLMNRSGSD